MVALLNLAEEHLSLYIPTEHFSQWPIQVSPPPISFLKLETLWAEVPKVCVTVHSQGFCVASSSQLTRPTLHGISCYFCKILHYASSFF